MQAVRPRSEHGLILLIKGFPWRQVWCHAAGRSFIRISNGATLGRRMEGMVRVAKTLTLIVMAAAGLCGHAQTQANRVGNTSYLNNSTGPSATVTTIGASSYYSDSSGLSGSATRVGDTRYSSFSNGVSGSSRRVGNTTYVDRSDGTSLTVRDTGNTRQITDTSGRTTTCSRIGNTLSCR